MKATGIIRRIDDLGRVVIPKEIRRSMNIREGDPLEIFTTNQGEVVFKKYNATSEPYIKNACKALFAGVVELYGIDNVAIYDNCDMLLYGHNRHYFYSPIQEGVKEYFAHEGATVIPLKVDYDDLAYLVIRGECDDIKAVKLLVKMAEVAMNPD